MNKEYLTQEDFDDSWFEDFRDTDLSIMDMEAQIWDQGMDEFWGG